MSSSSSQSWSVRHHHARGHIVIADTGITFKSTAGMDDKAAVTATEISNSKVAFLILGPRTRQLRLTKPDGTVVRFDGFKRDDVENITALFQSQFNVAVDTVYPSSTGKNFGTLDLEGDSVSFKIDDKICAEFHTEDIAQVVKQGDLQVEMQFEERQLQGSDAQLMRIQFYVPDDHSPDVGAGDDLDEDQVEALSTGAGRLRHRLVAAAGITSVTGEKILALPDDVGTFLAPRGRYVVEMYQTYFRLYGKQYDNRVFYQDIVSYFLLHNPNGVEQVFIITLRENKKLRMGNQSYQHLVMNMKSNKNVNINIWPSPEKLIEMFGANDKGEAKLNQEYANVPLPKTVATLFREISGKKVFVAGSFESHKGGHAVRSALKNSDGLLFPTRNTLIFIHKPTIFIKYKDILTIEFQRYDGQMGRSHTFDLCVSCRSVGGEAPREWTFSSIDKHEYTRLLAYLHGKQNIEVKNMLVESGGRGRGRAGRYAEDADAAMNMFGGDDDEGSDADSDFDAGKAADAQSSSSDDSDDSDASGTSDDSGGSGDDEYGGDDDNGSSKKRKRKKDKENKPKKKTKKKTAPAKKKGAKMPKKDPNAPKRPLTSFMMYSQKHREAIKAQNPDVSFGQIGKLLGQQWKAIGAEEKAEIEEQAATAKTTYAAMHKTYMESDERKQWEAAMMAKFGQIPGVKVKKTKAGAEKKKQKGPKRARGAYAYFMQAKRNEIKEANPEAAFGDIARLVSAAWKACSEEDKKVFFTLAEEDKVRAKTEKDAFEKKVKEEKEARGEVSSMSEDTSSSSGSDSDDEDK